MEKEVREFSFDAQVGAVKTTAEETSFGIEVREASGKESFKTRESLEILDEGLSGKLDEYDKVSGKEFRFQGVPAVKLVYTFRPFSKSGSPRKPLKQEQLIFLKNEKLYLITFTTSVEDYRRDNNDFGRILKSFRVD